MYLKVHVIRKTTTFNINVEERKEKKKKENIWGLSAHEDGMSSICQ